MPLPVGSADRRCMSAQPTDRHCSSAQSADWHYSSAQPTNWRTGFGSSGTAISRSRSRTLNCSRSLSGTSSVGPTDHSASQYLCTILRHGRRNRRGPQPRRLCQPTTIPPVFQPGHPESRHVAEFYAPQADRGPEEASSLVTLARRSQPGQEGDVNSQILKTLTTSISRDLGVDIPLLVWLPCGRQGDEGGRSRPPTDPTTLLPQHPRPGPFPSEPGPPEACSSQ